ncbi:TetR/AcrR family transcriptional regulator [Glycomyces sp. L485]|uniref:TetR/AcrR family transcriptional regulator n=1 Tax=Glycomyces sp. L485 TaxID=2909235 RepID=UPI001F4B8F02|nr:TetR/AcrR family transcriptional regulator [Glycomyces sp. L485]MCH7229943.1 TetR/AcrR family transcriptional regulator [Glycomyces sp. L485]
MNAAAGSNRRADAHRSRAAILDAAVRVLNVDPDAGLGTVASAAGLTRQTVYAHFATRDRLLLAVTDRLAEETVAAMDAADDDAGSAADALVRVLDAAVQVAHRYSVLLAKISSISISSEDDHERHTELHDRIRNVIERGQLNGEFDAGSSADWLATATIALAHAAGAEENAGRMSASAAQEAFRTSLLRMLTAGPNR